MTILVTSATFMEITPMADWLSTKPHIPENISIEYVIGGIGLVATAARMAAIFSRNGIDLVIQAGIAGSFSEEFGPGSVCQVTRDRIADLGVEEIQTWKDVFDMGLEESNSSTFTEGWLCPALPSGIPATGLPEVSGISVNEITTRPERIAQYRRKYDPVVESMEGAALFFAADEAMVPAIQIRSISNYIGERDKSRWKMKEAITNLNHELIGYLQKLASSQP